MIGSVADPKYLGQTQHDDDDDDDHDELMTEKVRRYADVSKAHNLLFQQLERHRRIFYRKIDETENLRPESPSK